MLVPIILLSCFSLVSRARVFPNPHLALGRPVKEADTKAFVSWGKAFHKLLEIFQKVSRNFSKRCSKVAKKKTIKSCSKKQKRVLVYAKKCKLYKKSKISKHFCAILWRNQRC